MRNNKTDVLLIGGGIMSATLGMLLHHMKPALHITMIEQLPDVAMESTDALNNAGTGHAGYCELNYTPENADKVIETDRALEINAAFEVSLQFWSYLVEAKILPKSDVFINKIPHISFVKGKQNIDFLKRRFVLLKQHHLFEDMQFSDTFSQLEKWLPLMMAERNTEEDLAATYITHGTDVNFGALTRHLVDYLKQQPNFTLLANTQVKDLNKVKEPLIDNSWRVDLFDLNNKDTQTINADFVFLGAGGGALPLLQKTDIKQSKGYGGFPVSGQWLICDKPDIVKQHRAKVYGKAAIGAPPMSVPHLDTRIIDGKPVLLFGPFAGFSTKFLKTGSVLDLAKSIKADNLKAMIGVGKNHLDLTKYLIKETTQTHEQRMDSLRRFLPQAVSSEWKLAIAGQRVQIIKNCNEKWGKLEFGTEIVTATDGSLAALLGASPGASVSVQAMIDVLDRCFKHHPKYAKDWSSNWQTKLKKCVPSYGESLIEKADLLRSIRKHNNHTLNLN